MSKNKKNDLQLVILRTVNNDYDLNSLKAILDEENIPYIIKDRGIGGYMRVIGGNHLYGTDILVEESVVERAEKILSRF